MVESIKEEEWKILKELMVKRDGWFVPGLSMRMKQKASQEKEKTASY